MNKPSPIYYINPILSWLFKHGWEGGQIPHGPPEPQPWSEGPEPIPWRSAVAQLVEAAKVREVAARLPEGQQRNAMLKGAAGAIDSVMDDFCGTVPHRWPWPWPGPPPWVWQIVSELSAVANAVQAGALREEISGITTQVLTRANEMAR
jgi:hypothetical protein